MRWALCAANWLLLAAVPPLERLSKGEDKAIAVRARAALKQIRGR